MKSYPKVMISQPMQGLSQGEIIEKWEAIRYKLLVEGYDVISTFVEDNIPSNVIYRSTWYLAKSLEHMSTVNAVYFCKGWENARGCRIEHEVAKAYHITCLYEE